MVLTDIDYQNIANQIEVGSGSIEYEKSNEIIIIAYTYTEEGYREDDYYRGTGAYIVTGTFLSVEDADSYNVHGEATKNNFCESQLLTMIA